MWRSLELNNIGNYKKTSAHRSDLCFPTYASAITFLFMLSYLAAIHSFFLFFCIALCWAYTRHYLFIVLTALFLFVTRLALFIEPVISLAYACGVFGTIKQIHVEYRKVDVSKLIHTFHSSLFDAHFSQFTSHSLLNAHSSVPTPHYSLFLPNFLLLITLLFIPYSILLTLHFFSHYSLLIISYYLLFTACSPLRFAHFSLHTLRGTYPKQVSEHRVISSTLNTN